MARVGYTRVSTVAQTLDQQNAALEAAGVTKMFSDTMSGARDDRPGLAALLDYVRPGDTVVVWKLDRLGRNMIHILQTVKELTDQGVTLVSTSDGIDSSTAAGRISKSFVIQQIMPYSTGMWNFAITNISCGVAQLVFAVRVALTCFGVALGLGLCGLVLALCFGLAPLTAVVRRDPEPVN